jgi:hypothetical protein
MYSHTDQELEYRRLAASRAGDFFHCWTQWTQNGSWKFLGNRLIRMVQHLTVTSNSLPDIAACGLELQQLSAKILNRIAQHPPAPIGFPDKVQARQPVFASR